MYCNNCGMKLDEDVLFCPNCGTKVSGTLQAGADEEKTVLLEPEVNEGTEYRGDETEKEPAAPQETAVPQEPAAPQETAVPQETAEAEQAVEPVQTPEPVQETGAEQTEEQLGESAKEPGEPAVEKVEAVEILPANVAETNETTLVQVGHFEQKKFCPNCGSENGINDLFCQVCGMSFDNVDKAFQGNVQNEQNKQSKFPKNKLKIVLPAAAVAAVALIALCIFAVPRVLGALGINVGFLGGGRNQSDFILYIKDNELNYAKSNKFEPLLIDDKCYEDKDDSRYSYGYNVTCTDDNKYIYYPHNIDSDTGTYDLYRKKLGDAKAEAEKIDSNVVTYKLIDNNRVAYIKDRDDLRLYIYNKGESSKVASDVTTWDMYVSDDGKYVGWRSNDGDGNMYVQDTDLKSDKVKLDSDVNEIYEVSDDLNLIVYEKDDNLYILKDLEEKEKIASDIEGAYVYGINDHLQIYYAKEGDGAETSCYDLIEDDYRAADEQMSEPLLEDYQTIIYRNGWPYTETNYDAYYEAYDKYSLKLMRDEIRDYMKNRTMMSNDMEIYHYDLANDESSKVYEGYADDGGSLGTDTALLYFWTIDLDNFEGPKLSKLIEEDYYSWENKLESDLREYIQLQYIVDGEVFEVSDMGIDREDLSEISSLEVYANEKTHTMYIGYEHYSEYERSLMDGSISADSTSKTYSEERYIELYSFDYNVSDADAQKISDEVISIEGAYDEGIYYINGDDELYCNDTKIDNDVYASSVRNEDGMVLYLTDISKDYNEGTLKLYRDGEAVKIADDTAAGRYRVFDKNKVVFLSDYNFNKYRGDLSVYNGKEVIKVDSDVQTFFICN